MDRRDEASTEAFDDTFAGPEMVTREPLITTGRIVNGAIVLACFAGVISSIVCLAVMAHKHNEIISYEDPEHSNADDNEVCILFASAKEIYSINGTATKPGIKYNRSHTCQFVIFGSGVIAGLLLVAIVYHIVRLFLWLSINPLVFSEVVGFGILLVLSFAIAVVVSTGRAYTCDRVTKDQRFNKCQDVKIYYRDDPKSDRDPVYIYSALKTSEISAWISFLILLAVVIVAVAKMVIWFMRRSARRRDERQLDSLISPNNEDDDEDPLPM